MAVLSPVAKQQFHASGVPASGYLLYTYATGTSTPQATYKDQAGAVAHTNPIVLDADGYVPGGGLYLTDGITYDYVLKTPVGASVWTQEKVAPPSASGVFIAAEAASVERTVQDKGRESLSVLDFMTTAQRTAAIDRTGLVDHSEAIVTAMSAAKTAGKRLHFPAGLYIRDVSTLQATFANDESLHIYGDGMGATVIKEADGRTLADGRFTKVLYFLAPDGVTAGNLTVENLTIDKNGASNGAEPSAYAWEQAHCCEINASSTGSFRNVVIRNVDTLDKVGGGVVFAAGRVMQATVENVHGREFSALFSQRGDIEFQASIDSLIARGCTGKYVQCEPDDATPSAGILPVANFFDCVYENLDFAGYSGATTSQTVNLTNVKATTMIDVRSVKILADNCYFVVGDGNSEYWSRTANGSTLTDCEIVNKYTSAGDTIAPFYPKHESTGSGTYLDLVRCKFVPGTGASATTTGYAIAQTTVYNPATGIPYKVRFVECEFSSLYQYLGDFYRAGVFEFIRCTLACRSHAFRVGRDATYVTRLTIDDCDTSAVTGGIVVRYVGLTPGPTLTIRGSHDLFYWVWGSDVSITGVDDNTKFVGIFTSDTAPTGGGVAGQRVRINAPAAGAPSEYVCTASHLTAATWVVVNKVGLSGSKTQDWADLATATQQSTTVTVTGAALGDKVSGVSMSVDLQLTELRGYVSAADTVTVVHRNDTGGNINLASGTLRVTVDKA